MTWWARLWRREQLEHQLDAELRDHFERQVADYVRDGTSEADARRRARLEFGGMDQIKEECRDARGTRWVEDVAQDVRYSLRVLAGSPAFTLVAVVSLALGIGANTAIFSLVNSLLLRTLPVAHAERLVLLDEGSWTNPIWEQIRARQDELFDGATAWAGGEFNLAASGPTDFVQGLMASGRFFEVLGVPAMIGRTFGPEDDRRGGGPDGPVAVISYAFWQRHFAGGDVLGRPLTLDGVAFTVIGVTPPSFFGPDTGRSFDVIVPIGTEPLMRGEESALDRRSTWWLNITARLKPGQTVEQATAALRGVQPQIRQATLPSNWPPEELARYLGGGFTLVPSGSGPAVVRDRYQRPLLTIMAVVAFILLIACANVANLMLARANARRHELAVRLAIGASRFRIGRQLLTESLLIAAAGAALGLLVARWGSQLLVRQLSTPREAVFLDLSLDWRVLAFTATVAVLTALLFGIAPAFRLGRVEPTEAFKEQGRQVAGETRHALSSPLVIVQVALSLVLVIGAGLFVRTFASLSTLDLGFDPQPLLLVQVDAQRSTVSATGRGAMLARAADAAAAVPGVASAAASMLTPMSGMGWNTLVELPDGPPLPRNELMSWMNAVMPGWFATYRTRLVAGRDFGPEDRLGGPPVAIVNEAFLRKFVADVNPLGHMVHRQSTSTDPEPPLEIVGVVADSAYRSLREPFPPTMYVPVAQRDEAPPFASVTVRAAAGPPERLTRSVAAAIADVDPNLALTFLPMSAQINGALVQERLLAVLSGAFGALALLLAAIGLYGVTAYGVTRRRTEIGIRMALGADARKVVALILRRTAVLVGAGLLLGATVGAWISRYVATLLYGVAPTDPVTFLAAALVLAAVGACAAWLPARRAAAIDPGRVLREG